MNFLQWAVWGAYLTSMGSYLVSVGLAEKIGIFYAMQGVVSIFMPAIIGIIADKYVPAQRLLGLCHLIAGAAMIAAGYYGLSAGADVKFGILFPLYAVSVAFYMPTIALSNSVAFKVLVKNGFDTVTDFPLVRVFGTVGFICSMLFVNFMTDGDGVQFQHTYNQFFVSGFIGFVLFIYCLSLPDCPVNRQAQSQSVAEALGAKAFRLFKDRGMATFFIFSMLLGVALQITNGFANPFISHFTQVPEYADSCPFEKLEQTDIDTLLREQPALAERCGITEAVELSLINDTPYKANEEDIPFYPPLPADAPGESLTTWLKESFPEMTETDVAHYVYRICFQAKSMLGVYSRSAAEKKVAEISPGLKEQNHLRLKIEKIVFTC